MKILICGATGFIGRNIAETLAADGADEIYGTRHDSGPLDDPKIKMVKCDLTDQADVGRTVKGMDVIIQAAASTSGVKDILSRPYYHVTDNAVMNSLIFRSAFEHNIKHVVFFSCSVMYRSGGLPVREEDFDANAEMHPAYFGAGWTKVYLEKMCEFYSRLRDTKYTVIRHSNIYGPYDKFDLERSHVFGATLTKVMAAKEGGRIKVWGTGEEARDLLYVSDLVELVKLALQKQRSKFELFNAGCGTSVSVKDLAGMMIKHSGKNLALEFEPGKPSIKTKLCLDSSRVKARLGWERRVSLDDGIRKTMDWYRKHLLRPE